MDFFEKLMPLIFLIIWIVAAVSRQKKKKPARPSDTADKPSPATVVDKLQNPLKYFVAELEKQMRGQILPPAPAPEPALQKAPRTKEAVTINHHDVVVQKKETPRPSTIKTCTPAPHCPDFTQREGKTAFSVTRLREAVIWSEILAKPVSLRNE